MEDSQYNKIVKVAIEVEDMEASLAFYNHKCGMRILERFPQQDGGECVFLDARTIILELMTPKKGDTPFHHIALEAYDVNSAADHFKRLWAPVTMEPIVVEENIHLADVSDPDGVRIRLFHRDE